jgi:hypothetical protein
MPNYPVGMFDVSAITITNGTFDGESGQNMSGATITLPASGGVVETEIFDDDTEFNEGDTSGAGAQVTTEDLTIDGQTFPSGTVIEVEYVLILEDGAGNQYTAVAINLGGGSGTNATIEALIFVGDLPPRGEPLTVVDVSNNPDVPYESITPPPCFAAGTSLATPAGQRPVEALAPGDLVLTRDNGPQPVRWIGGRRVTAGEIARATKVRLAPVRIRRGAFGSGRPRRDLLVSPQHRILVTGWRAELHFGEAEVLVAACHLVDGEAVTVEPPGRGVTYLHIMFDRHEIVRAEGLPAESFRAGPEAMRSIPAAAREELLALFPELSGMPDGLAPARPILSGAEATLVRA